ncbi:IS630 family transposase [Streptomyces sp. CA-210063]|uniref:IS630 family transposase n=1 Tax=Streptomyces sp. CA-210063 TaxID=2801029 RepID=UPI00214C49B1|nr:IS630 family transposase [Streptomyces sp. CA-210063]UUU36733.1 IS630 family transposase [Streptomyces sp. CA-210063]
MPVASPFQVAWDGEQRKVLEELTRSRTAPLRRVQRARAALACAEGDTNAAIARALGVHLDTVRRWRKRFGTEGLSGLEDRPRAGRSRRYGPEVHLAIVATVTSAQPATDSHWTHRAIAHRLASTGISASQVGRILADLDLKPHLVRGWLTRPDDPDFHARAAEVCSLYLLCPPHSVVLSVDEKTAMQARSRRHPTRLVKPGQIERREFEYRRHGTASIIATLDVHTGQVLVEDIIRNDSAAFIRFLRLLDQSIDPALTIHLVLDNGSSHVSKATRPGWQRTRGSPSTTHPNTPPGSTRSKSSSRFRPAGCCDAASSPRARTSSTRSATSRSPTTTRPARSAGPTTEPHSKPHDPRKINAALH